MSVLLGNLSVAQMENRLGITFPADLVEFMGKSHQDTATNIGHGKWHCFDMPFVLVCGDMETAVEINKYLSPLSSKMTGQLQISLST